MKKRLEIACFSIESAIVAYRNGADRIEFCSDYTSGGLTPSLSDTKIILNAVDIPVFIMIRPKTDGFVYSENELNKMKEEIIAFKTIGIAGFVFGILDSTGKIDGPRNRELVAIAHPLPCTFHRAFDGILDKVEALETVINCGFKYLLTSGGEHPAEQGVEMLKRLIQISKKRLRILVGGGIRSQNIRSIAEKTNADYFHSAAIINSSNIADSQEITIIKKELAWIKDC